MSTPASSSRLGSEFDAFLFAPIGEDRNGLTLATLLAALSDPSLKPADAGKMAIRLIAQLPGRPAADLGVTWSATHPCRGPSPRPDDRNLVCDLDDLGVGYARHGPA